MKKGFQAGIAGLLILSASLAFSAPQRLPVDSRSDLSLTIYNQNLAMVSDTRSVTIPKGATTLSYTGISPQINAASAILYPLPESVRVLQQRFQAATGPAELLDKAVGQGVSLLRNNPENGQLIKQRAKIISTAGGLIFEVDGHLETDLAGRRIVYDQLPGIVHSPTLSFDIETDKALKAPLSLRYLSRGLSWQADYIAQLDLSAGRMRLRGMASLRNDSGVDFPDAGVSLMAGSVNQTYAAPIARGGMVMMASEVAAAPPPPMEVADLKRYDIPGRVTLANHSSVQVQLFEAHNVSVSRHYRLDPGSQYFYAGNAPSQRLTVDSFIEFDNVSEQGLGFPLPAGTVRVYSSAKSDELNFIGEDHVDDSPEQALVRLKTGQAFDLSAEREQLMFKRLPVEQPYRRNFEIEWQTRLLNVGKEDRVVELIERFEGEWLLKNGRVPDQSDAHSAHWNVKVPAQGEITLKLRVQLKS